MTDSDERSSNGASPSNSSPASISAPKGTEPKGTAPKETGSALPDSETPDQPLPELLQAELNDETLSQLFTDIEACTEVLDVSVKRSVSQMIDQEETSEITLKQAQQWLREKVIRGAQIRYIHEKVEWWDKLIVVPNGGKLTRIQHKM